MNKKYLKFSLIGAILGGAILVSTITPAILLSQQTAKNTSATNAELGKVPENNVQTVTNVNDINYHFSQNTSVSFAIVKDKINGDRLYAWGPNTNGELGIGSSKPYVYPTPELCQGLPVKATINSVHSGESFTAVVVNKNQLYLTGGNRFGQQGNGNNIDKNIISFTKNTTLSDKGNITAVSTGNYHALAVVNNEVYGWGWNNNSQVNGEATSNINTPTKINGLPSGNLKMIIATSYNSYAWIDNKIYSWGYYKGLGSGVDKSTGTPTAIPFPVEMNGTITKFTAGWDKGLLTSCFVVIDNHKLFGWGSNTDKKMGIDAASLLETPITIPSPQPGEKIDNVFASSDFTSIEINKKLYTAGNNQYGQLSNGATSNTPVIPFAEIKNYTSNTSTIYNMFAFGGFATTDGVTHAWGNNLSGNFGNGEFTQINPTPISADTFKTPTFVDSKIKNDTAAIAFDKLWNGSVINNEVLKQYLTVTLPSSTTMFTATAGTTPTYDETKGTITLSLTSNEHYYSYPDGARTQTTVPIELTITGFRLSDISVKANYPKTELVHELMDILNPNNFVSPKELETYLNFINVPIDTGYQINANPVYDYALGKVSFQIRMDRYYAYNVISDSNVVVVQPSNWIPITLTVAPRITNIEARTDYWKMNVGDLKDYIFDASGIAKINKISEYIKITAPVPGAKLHLLPGSYIAKTGMGNVNFTVFYDKYYAADGTEKTQTANTITKSYPISLNLLPMATVISSKATYTATHRVDQFISAFTDASGNVTNEAVLKQYLDINHLPDGYTLKISDVNIIDLLDGTISFNVIASQYNDSKFQVQTNGVFSISLLKLIPKYPATSILAKAEGSYDDSVRVDRFIPLFANETNIVTDLDVLGEFLDIVAIPTEAVVMLKNINITNATGKITFNVEVSKHYNDDSQLVNTAKLFPITLYLGIKYMPTEITANTDIIYPERIDRFMTKITELSGTVALHNYLIPKYITVTGDLPEENLFSVANIVDNQTTGVLTFDLVASDYYDENSDAQKDVSTAISINLRIKAETTVLVAKTEGDYDASVRVDRFAHNIKMYTDRDLKNYLASYIDGTDTLAPGSSLVASEINSNSTTGVISFKLTANKYYDADSDLQIASHDWNISLELAIKQPATTITAKAGDFTNIVVDTLIPSFTNEQMIVDDRDELNKYVDIVGLPTDAQLSVKDVNMTLSSGTILFKIVANKFYDGESDLITTRNHEYIIGLTLGIKHEPTTVNAIRGYAQTEKVTDFANQIKTLTGTALKTYLDTYIEIGGSLPADAVMSVDSASVIVDQKTGKVSFTIVFDKYIDAIGSASTNGRFTIKLKLAH